MTRCRFAPSPTGLLHAGSVRTALFNRLFARKNPPASFILRMEDTDAARSSREFEKAIMEDLRWLGLDWDEGPDTGGGFAPYRQSERLSIYRECALRLLNEKKAYLCYCSKERLAELKEKQIKKGFPPRYDRKCLEAKAPPSGTLPATRFIFPPGGKIEFQDMAHGHLSFESSVFGDFIIMGSDGVATYNFAAAVDDAFMEITHVIRGDDHLPNTPRQLALLAALGHIPPVYMHLPLVLGPDKTPLGKRHESLSIKKLREEGYLPGGILNTVFRLGFAPPERYLLPDEMAELFSPDAISRSPSSFDVSRLKRYNKAAISAMTDEKIVEYVRPAFKEAEMDALLKAVSAVKDSAATLNEITAYLTPIFKEPLPGAGASAVLSEVVSKKILETLISLIEADSSGLTRESWNAAIQRLKETHGPAGRLFMPIRASLTGETKGIELDKIVELLGKEKVLERLKKSLGA